MSMGFLLPRFTAGAVTSNIDTPLVWRGLMVQKAVQQLLFDVDWRDGASSSESGQSTILPHRPHYCLQCISAM